MPPLTPCALRTSCTSHAGASRWHSTGQVANRQRSAGAQGEGGRYHIVRGRPRRRMGCCRVFPGQTQLFRYGNSGSTLPPSRPAPTSPLRHIPFIVLFALQGCSRRVRPVAASEGSLTGGTGIRPEARAGAPAPAAAAGAGAGRSLDGAGGGDRKRRRHAMGGPAASAHVASAVAAVAAGCGGSGRGRAAKRGRAAAAATANEWDSDTTDEDLDL